MHRQRLAEQAQRPTDEARGTEGAAGDEHPIRLEPLQRTGPDVAADHRRPVVLVVELHGEDTLHVLDRVRPAEGVEGLGRRVHQLRGASGHAQPAADAFGRAHRQAGLPHT